MAIFRNYILPIIVGVALLGFTCFFFYAIYWVGKKLGIYRGFKVSRIKRKFKKTEFEFDDETVAFCKELIEKKWRMKDVVKFTKGNPEGDRIIYIFYLLKKIK